MKVKEIMNCNVVSTKSDTTIEEIIKIMVTKNVGCLPVVDSSNRVVGIISQKDIIYKDIEPKQPMFFEFLGSLVSVSGIAHYNEELKKLAATKAKDIMTGENLIITGEDVEVEKIADIMVEKDINRIPVVDKNNMLVGIVSRADLIRYIAKIME